MGLIPADSTITVVKEFKAVKDRNLVDVGLFCRRDWFDKKEIIIDKAGRKYGKVTPLDMNFGPPLQNIKVWTGSLYASIQIEVK